MNRRQALRILAPSLLVRKPVHALVRQPSGKKGWCGNNREAHKTFGVHWYYTWWTGGNDNRDIEFVPMIKGAKELAAGAIQQAKSLDIKHLLGYNEPERADQGNLNVADALTHWPKLEALAAGKNIPLGSPAPSSDARGVQWLDAFMEQAKRRKLRVDFIAIHWYRGRDAAALEAFIKELARRHRLPVWLTEFNGWSGGEKENRVFLGDALRFLERDRVVERYAYFEPGKGKPHSLFHTDGSLTRMGEIYRAAGA